VSLDKRDSRSSVIYSATHSRLRNFDSRWMWSIGGITDRGKPLTLIKAYWLLLHTKICCLFRCLHCDVQSKLLAC
jgi:hypothetical protein